MFTRDLVIFDVESTGLDVSKHEIIQIAGIRLHKDTLAEVSRFTTYVKPTRWEEQMPAAMEVNKITFDKLEKAPQIAEALKEFETHFPPEEVMLTAYNAPFDTGFFRQSYIQQGRQAPYEYHTFDIWSLAYLYWSSVPHKNNPTKPIGFGLSDMAELLKIPPAETYHEALADCEIEAEVLRKLLGKLEIRN